MTCFDWFCFRMFLSFVVVGCLDFVRFGLACCDLYLGVW